MTEPIVFTRSEHYSRTLFGFWVYLLTDCVMFGALFASYVVLRHNAHVGPTEHDLFRIWDVLGDTLLLLTASLFAGLARVQAFRNKVRATMGQMVIATVLGAWFLSSTFIESQELWKQGATWQASAFLSAFFTVIWTHSLHIVAAILWSLVLLWQLARRGITEHTFRRLSLWTLFWQFLNILWIFTFTIVYLMGIGGL